LKLSAIILSKFIMLAFPYAKIAAIG